MRTTSGSEILWGICTDNPHGRSDYWLKGLARNRQPGDRIILTQADRIATAYNQILDTADDQTVVLLHDDTELLDGARDAILATTADVVGVCGSTHPIDLCWWKYGVRGGVAMKHAPLTEGLTYGTVKAIDGLIMILSPATVRRVRFDEDYDGFHGYDIDFCFQAHKHGLTVRTAPIPVVHQSTGGFGDREAWKRANLRFKKKWGL